MSDMAAESSAASELPRSRTDWLPLLLVPALALLALPFVGSGSTWVTLTVAGLAMGMMIFLMASGLTLVFGLMDIINFGHGVFISLGAYATLLVLGPLAGWAAADSIA
jgi:branched-chain amino acid transport system permease protein